VLAVLLLASPAHAISIAPQTPRSPNAESIATSYWVMLVVFAALVVALHAALITVMIRFRARRGRRPPQVTAARGALRPAVAALGAMAVAVFVFGVVMKGQARSVEATGPEGLEPATATAQVGVTDLPEPAADADPETAPLEIDAIAQQWVWRFEYPGHQPGQALFSYGELVVPVDTTVLLNVRSIDVAHTWWIPALGGQVQALPGSVNRTWFKATEEGRYEGSSTMFSGTGFPSVRGWVRVVDPSTYRSYIQQLAIDLDEAQSAVAETLAAEEPDVEGAPEGVGEPQEEAP
jgi:cytochrome c oxidase subunit II